MEKKDKDELVQEEIESQVKAIKAEWREAVEELGEIKPPKGLSKTEGEVWRLQQTGAAKQRLQVLEERLRRLQMLDSQVRKLKVHGGAVATNAPSGWDLPGVPDAVAVTAHARPPVALAGNFPEGPGAASPPKLSEWVSLDKDVMAELMGHQEDIARQRGTYARPISPGMIRQIIREEMSAKEAADRPPMAAPLDHGHLPHSPSKERVRTAGAGTVGFHDSTHFFQEEGGNSQRGEKTRFQAGQDAARAMLKSAHGGMMRAVTTHGLGLDIEYTVPRSCNLLFGGFSRRSAIRKWCFHVYTSPAWSFFFTAISLANSVYIAVVPEYDQSRIIENDRNAIAVPEDRWDALHVFDFFCVTMLTVEILFGSIAIGFVMYPSCWLRCSEYHKLEFFILLVTITEYFFTWQNMQGVTVRPFRLLRLFKSVTQIRTFNGVRVMMNTLGQGVGQLAVVLSLLLFFTAAWSIFGMAIYMTSFRRRCVSTERPVPVCASDFSTNWSAQCDFTTQVSDTQWGFGDQLMIFGMNPSERLCKRFNETELGVPNGTYDATWPRGPDGVHHSCGMAEFESGLPVYQKCMDLENPRFGLSHFDHVGGAMLAVTQVSAMDLSYEVLWQSLESEPTFYTQPLTFLFYFVVTTFNTFLLLGLFVAVVTGTFQRVRESQQKRNFLSDEQSGDPSPRKGYRQHQAQKKSGADILNADDADFKNLETEDEVLMVKGAGKMIRDPRFEKAVTLVILVNLAAMSADQYDASPTWKSFSYWVYVACAVVFSAETMVRFAAAGSLGVFWQSNFHRYEVAMCLSAIVGLASDSPVLILITATRFYRLMIYLPTLYELLESALNSMQAIFNLILFISIIAVCFCTTGRYVFGDTVDFISRSNFSSFSLAMLTIFQLFAGDGWSDVLYASMSVKEKLLGQVFAGLFIMTWFIFSKLIAANLFVAVIIENFEVAVTVENIRRPGRFQKLRDDFRRTSRGIWKYAVAKLDFRNRIDNKGEKLYEMRQRKLTESLSVIEKDQEERKAKLQMMMSTNQLLPNEDPPESPHFRRMVIDEQTPTRELTRQCGVDESVAIARKERLAPERVLYFFRPTNPIRRFFVWVGNLFIFDMIVYGSIITSCGFLCITPVYTKYPPTVDWPDGNRDIVDPQVLATCNMVFTILFTIEATVRIMTDGLIFTKDAYLKSGWNFMDFMVLVFAWIDESNILSQGRIVSVVRLARALRPLRLMKRNQGMRLVIDALILSLAPVAYVAVFSIFTFAVFGLIGMGLFGGRFYSCSGPGAEYPAGKGECSGAFVTEDGMIFPRVWANPPYSYDSFVASVGSLFRVNNMKYVDMQFTAMDITNIDQSPLEGASSYNALFFIIYLLVGGLFVMNLFVGFIVDGFNANKGTTDADLQYSRFLRQLYIHRPRYSTFRPPEYRASQICRSVILSPYFEYFSGGCVLINVGFMLADHPDPNPQFISIVDTQNLVFLVELWLEVLGNFVGFGPGGFVNDMWRSFDVLVALGTTAGYIDENPSLSQFVKAFRLLRLVRLMKMIKPIRVILETLIATIPQLGNILLLLTLVYSMFSVVAVQGFSTTKWGTRLSPTANFEDFSSAMLTVVQLVTGDEWQDMLLDCQVEPPACTVKFDKSVYGWEEWGLPEYDFGDCGSTSMASIFFISFTLVCSNIMLNLFIGMILDNFSFITDEVAQEEDANWIGGASSDQIAALTTSFKMFDRGTTYIPISSVLPLMQVMYKPLGFVDPVTLSVDTTHAANAAYKMVRAELNLILQAEWNERRRLQKKGFLRRLMSFEVTPQYKTRFAMCIAYEDLMKVLLYWRKPDMVPYNIKVERFDRLQEALRMNAALTLSDFFRGTVAARKRQKMQGYLQKRVAFTNWQNEDAHRIRRMAIVSQVKAEKQILAENGVKGKGMEMRLPSEVDSVNVEKIDIVPPIMQTHRELIDSMEHEHLKPMHGVDVFLQHSPNRVVVVRFLDPRNASSMPMALVDFSSADWMGWIVRNTSHDTFFEPMRFQENGPKGIDWTQIQLVRRRGKNGARQKVVNLGSLIDMTSCVELRSESKSREELEAEGLWEDDDEDGLYDSDDDETNKKKDVVVMESGKNAKRARREKEKLEKEARMEKFKKTVPVSVLRINLGMMEHDEQRQEMTVSEEIRRDREMVDEFLDGCAEVMGYMPSDFVMPLPGAGNPYRDRTLNRKSSLNLELFDAQNMGGSFHSPEHPAKDIQRSGPSFLLQTFDEIPMQEEDSFREEDLEDLLREMEEEEQNDKGNVASIPESKTQ